MQTTDAKTVIANRAQGNPGAALFLCQLYQEDADTFNKVIETGIEGWPLYVLFSDICGRDLPTVKNLVSNCPIDLLKDACGREDYSGKELVKEYLN